MWTQHCHVRSLDPGPYPGSVETPHESISDRLPRLDACVSPCIYPLWAWHLQGPAPEQLQNLQVLFLFPILCYPVEQCLLLPFHLPNTEKVHPALLSTTGLKEAQDGPECRASDPPRMNLFPFSESEKDLTLGMQRLDSFLSDESIATGNKAQINFPAGHLAISCSQKFT